VNLGNDLLGHHATSGESPITVPPGLLVAPEMPCCVHESGPVQVFGRRVVEAVANGGRPAVRECAVRGVVTKSDIGGLLLL
jgi:hypothetical protein